MFSQKGYVSLATLCGSFERQNLGWCQRRACAHFRSNGFNIYNVFGSPLDLCEDLFLSSLSEVELAFLTLSEKVIRSPSKLPNSNANFVAKATVFESMAIVHDPDEAGLDNEWLSQMGSSRFGYWPHTDAGLVTWGEKYCSGSYDHADVCDGSKMQFFTLPYCFERITFIFPKELPPWTTDMIDGSFSRNLSEPLLGSSICLDNASSGKWQRKVTNKYLEDLFVQLMGGKAQSDSIAAEPKAGRPRKLDAVAQAYVDLNLIHSKASWKDKRRLIEDRLNITFSVSTLKTAAKIAEKEK